MLFIFSKVYSQIHSFMSNLVEDKTVETQILDHGHPPKTISALVNKVVIHERNDVKTLEKLYLCFKN